MELVYENKIHEKIKNGEKINNAKDQQFIYLDTSQYYIQFLLNKWHYKYWFPIVKQIIDDYYEREAFPIEFIDLDDKKIAKIKIQGLEDVKYTPRTSDYLKITLLTRHEPYLMWRWTNAATLQLGLKYFATTPPYTNGKEKIKGLDPYALHLLTKFIEAMSLPRYISGVKAPPVCSVKLGASLGILSCVLTQFQINYPQNSPVYMQLNDNSFTIKKESASKERTEIVTKFPNLYGLYYHVELNLTFTSASYLSYKEGAGELIYQALLGNDESQSEWIKKRRNFVKENLSEEDWKDLGWKEEEK